MEKALIVSEIVKKIRGKEVLKNVSFEVEKGQLLVLLGPPGSGKTTLLKIIAGLEKQDSGSIYINGVRVDETPPYERKVSMVFETLALYSHMTVYENIASPMVAEKKPKDFIDKRVREIAGILRIEHLLDRRADKLSGGERQRVAVARALAKEAEIYLLDEPFSNLDAKIRYALRTEFKKLKTILGKTLVLATSDPLDALALGDAVVFIEKGEVVQRSTPVELYYKPSRLDIARYLTGKILNEVIVKKKAEGGKTVIMSELDIAISESVLRDLQEIPAENIVLASHPDTAIIEKSVENCDGLKLKGRFLGYEYRGSEFLVFAEYKNHLFKALKYEKPLIDFNEPVEVCISREGLNFYNLDTGALVR
ncbi:ABC transporter ATP-binding protein [Thermosphaera chiliense]|uniref:ABC transporter ATP-binding protein n=1 Tax=Thermosphaera chiliense TaxID=3402707 RepID=A0A7M1UTP1_9CREN|nr:ABC transporter ATP-binding protein [Thermosphaera aggregans]QOR94963.1 ABC transporter ATP-binding protein [Thermosphaera aggregans]